MASRREKNLALGYLPDEIWNHQFYRPLLGDRFVGRTSIPHTHHSASGVSADVLSSVQEMEMDGYLELLDEHGNRVKHVVEEKLRGPENIRRADILLEITHYYHSNDAPHGLDWRRIIDMEVGRLRMKKGWLFQVQGLFSYAVRDDMGGIDVRATPTGIYHCYPLRSWWDDVFIRSDAGRRFLDCRCPVAELYLAAGADSRVCKRCGSVYGSTEPPGTPGHYVTRNFPIRLDLPIIEESRMRARRELGLPIEVR